MFFSLATGAGKSSILNAILDGEPSAMKVDKLS